MSLVYESERAVLYHGDALRLLPTLEPACVDLLLADPPYSSGGMTRSDRVGSVHRKYVKSNSSSQALPGFSGDTRDQRGFTFWCSLWLSEALRVVKPGGIAAVFTDWRQLPSVTDALQAAGFVWRGVVTWCKPNGRRIQGRYANNNEFIVWGTNGPRPLEITPHALSGHFVINTPRQRVHLTEKPVELLRELVRVTPTDALVCDPFAGSGSTGVAALAEGRRFVGIEIDAHWCDTTAKRLSAFTPAETVTAGTLL